MSDFPENDVEIGHEYILARRDLIDPVIAALESILAIRVQSNNPFNGIGINQNAVARRAACSRVRTFLLPQNGTTGLLKLLDDIYKQLARRNPLGAGLLLATTSATVSAISDADIQQAFSTGNMPFIKIGGDPAEPTVTHHTLKGYNGPRLDAQELGTAHELVTGGPERLFRLGLLRAEIHFLKEEFGAAIAEYSAINKNTALALDRRKFAAIRSAYAHLARGDFEFRALRSPSESERTEIRKNYVEAAEIVSAKLFTIFNGAVAFIGVISPDNPLRNHIERYANARNAMLEAGFNYLGYRDSYVPVHQPEVLQELALRRVEAAQEAVSLFETFQRTFDEIQEQLAQLDFEAKIATKTIDQSTLRFENAQSQEQIAGTRVTQISDKIDSLSGSFMIEAGGALIAGLAAGFLAGEPDGIGIEEGTNLVGVGGAVNGFAGTIAKYRAERQDLEHQMVIAEIEKTIAGRDLTIAELEVEIATATVGFLREKIARIVNRELNPDLYYRAAEALRAIAVRHMDAAIGLAYLFERAVSFRRLKELHVIDFDYVDKGLLSAPNELRLALDTVVIEELPGDKMQDPIVERFSLKHSYPMEFQNFKQTGKISFSLSLYQLAKKRPGVFHARILRAGVQLFGSVSPLFIGRIVHNGSFMLRDPATTPKPGEGRFVPTAERLQEALAVVQSGAAQGQAIDGVIPFVLDADTIEISADTPFPGIDPERKTLQPIEGYGPAGEWTLIISDTDLRAITDVHLLLEVEFPEPDPGLAEDVIGLIVDYEKELTENDELDLITLFSLKARFPEAHSQLPSGQVNLDLRRDDFPAGIADLRLKTIVVMALDADAQAAGGVSLELSRAEHSFQLERTTRDDGFSENISAEIPVRPPDARFPVEGRYGLRLLGQGQPGLISDLLLFFVYEFRKD